MTRSNAAESSVDVTPASRERILPILLLALISVLPRHLPPLPSSLFTLHIFPLPFPFHSTMTARAAPLVFPATARHTATVIFAHGLGDSGHGWASAVENWRRRQRLDEVKFVLPHAPNIPITINMGMRMPGWYDIVSSLAPVLVRR